MQYSQAIDASGVWVQNSQGRTFVLSSTGAAASLGLEILRGGHSVFTASAVKRGFRFYDPKSFGGVRITGAAGTIVSYFLAAEDVQISTVDGSDVTISAGVKVTNAGALEKIPVDVFGAVLTATNVGIASPDTLAGVADVSLLAGVTTLIRAADAVNTEREIIIKNLQANAATIRVAGASAAAALGHELAPSESITLNTKAAIYGYNPGGVAQSVSVLINSRA